MIRMIAWILLLAVVGYVAWVIVLNLPGHGGHPAPAPRPATVPAPQAASIPAPAPASDQLVIPVAGVRADQLADTFDDARAQGRVHDAIDIMAPRGTPVVAAAAGRVEKLFDSKLGGRTIYIRRPGGQWMDYYAHLDAYVPGLAEGQQIQQGVMIGTVGSTGDASADAPHLHYAINAMAPGEGWWQGKPVNPYPLLKGAH